MKKISAPRQTRKNTLAMSTVALAALGRSHSDTDASMPCESMLKLQLQRRGEKAYRSTSGRVHVIVGEEINVRRREQRVPLHPPAHVQIQGRTQIARTIVCHGHRDEARWIVNRILRTVAP